MEELKKTTRKSSTTKATIEKASSTKKSAKQPKATTAEKQPKTTKTSVAKKGTKDSTVKKEAKTRTAKKEPKVETTKKATKESKAATIKKEPKTAKENITRKSQKVTTSKKVDTMPQNNKAKIEDEKMPKKKLVSVNEIAENKANKKKGKKYIEISIGLIIAIMIIGILIVLNVKLGMYAYNVTKEKSKIQNETVNSEVQLDEQVGTILNSKNQIVNQLVEKITLTPSATASMYKMGSFNTNTLTNDLKLRIGWANISDERKLRAKQANGDSIVAVEKSNMEESIKNIFGPGVEYRDESFNNTDVTIFIGSSQNPGIISYSNDMYTAKEIENLEEKVPLIYQEIQKVVQYDDRTVVYVKTAFINEEDGKLAIYKELNEEFENKVIEITHEELFNEISFNKYTGEGTVTVNTNSALNSIRNKLNTYTYTFTLDNSTKQYYLEELNLENSSLSI